MVVVHNAPQVGRSASCSALSDSADNTFGAIGVHNLGASAGTIKVNYFGRDDDEIGTVDLAVGEKFYAAIRRVRSTGTTLANTDLEVFFP